VRQHGHLLTAAEQVEFDEVGAAEQHGLALALVDQPAFRPPSFVGRRQDLEARHENAFLAFGVNLDERLLELLGDKRLHRHGLGFLGGRRHSHPAFLLSRLLCGGGVGDSHVGLGEVLILALGFHQDNVAADGGIDGIAAGQDLPKGHIDLVDEPVVEALPQTTSLDVGIYAGER